MSNSSSPFSNFYISDPDELLQTSQGDLTLGHLFAQDPVFEAVFKQAHAHPPEPTGIEIEVDVLAHTLPALSKKELKTANVLISIIRAALHRDRFDLVQKFSDQLLESRAVEHLCKPYKIEGTEEITLEYPEIIKVFNSYLETWLNPDPKNTAETQEHIVLILKDTLRMREDEINRPGFSREQIFLDQDLQSIPNPFTPFPSLSSSPEPEPLAGAGSGAGSDSMSNSPNSQPLSMTNSRCATPMLESSGRPRSEGFSWDLKGLSPLGAH